jgi:hypothetical protein
VTLDKWTREQLDYFVQFGNKAVNAYVSFVLVVGWFSQAFFFFFFSGFSYYEERLDEDSRPKVTDDYQMEQFIRAKYEKKRWAGKGNGPKALSSSRGGDESPPPAKV